MAKRTRNPVQTIVNLRTKGRRVAALKAAGGPSLPKPGKKRVPIGDVVPTSKELSVVMKALGSKSTAKRIQQAVDAAVKAGKVRPQSAKLLPTLVVYAQDRIAGVSQGTTVSTGTTPLDQRYFEGTKQQLRDARARERTGARKEFFQSSLLPELQRPISGFFSSPEGKKYLMTALRSRMKSGKAPEDTNRKQIVRELEKDAKGVAKAEASGEDPAVFQGVLPRMGIKESPSGKLASWRGYGQEGFYAPKAGERPDPEFSPEVPTSVAPRTSLRPDRTVVSQERDMYRSLIGGMDKAQKRRFEKLVGAARAKYPDIPTDAHDRLALAKMFPQYERFLEDYGSRIGPGRAELETQKPGPISRRREERARISSGRQMKSTLQRWRDLEKLVTSQRGREGLKEMNMEWDPSALRGGIE